MPARHIALDLFAVGTDKSKSRLGEFILPFNPPSFDDDLCARHLVDEDLDSLVKKCHRVFVLFSFVDDFVQGISFVNFDEEILGREKATATLPSDFHILPP